MLTALIALLVVGGSFPATRRGLVETHNGSSRAPSLVTRHAQPVARDTRAALPPDLAPVVLQTLQAGSDATYRPRPVRSDGSKGIQNGIIEARNDAHRFDAEFTPGGVTLSESNRRLELRLAGYGTADHVRSIEMQAWTSAGARVERGSADPDRPLVEWYINGRLGLEQGFTIAKPPDHPVSQESDVAQAFPPSREARFGEARRNLGGGGRPAPMDQTRTELTIELAVAGTWTPRMRGEDAVEFVDADGQAWLRYGHLYAIDADGRALAGRLAVREDRIVLRVDTAAAHYPVTIDPIVQQAQLTASDGAGSDNFGVSVAVSGDAAVVGARSDDSNQGAAYVFRCQRLAERRDGGGWGLLR
ncbi:MAG: FG-GAP repeat protein [Acidobacteria bacterium]|nr:FG-GAP repeat protein [Acidobacteriota bacterium]